MSKQKALDQFLATVIEIRATVAAIGEAADDHFGLVPDEVTWANVGDVERILSDLKNVLTVIRRENS